MKSFAHSLAFITRFTATRKWPINFRTKINCTPMLGPSTLKVPLSISERIDMGRNDRKSLLKEFFVYFPGANFDSSDPMAVHLKRQFRHLHWIAERKKRQIPQGQHEQELPSTYLNHLLILCMLYFVTYHLFVVAKPKGLR